MSAVTRVKLAMYAVICALLAFGVAGSAEAPVNCSGVRETLTGLGFPAEEEMLPEEATGGDLRVCAPHRSCCSSRMQENFHRRSSRDLQKILELTSEELRDTFMSGHKRFDDFFVELLESSERALNDMFVRTYGKPYMQNAEVFQGLFAELRRYYAGGNVHLEEMLSDFWTRLLERMFRLLNSEYVVSEDYLECISKHAEQLKPFGDVPRKLRSQVTRAFVSARTFVQGLMVGREVASKASAVSVSSQCVGRYSRMMFCWWCEGGSPAPPCRSHCLRVMKSCLQHQDQLQTPWSSFIDAMLLVTERLQGPFNIESVMEPIDVKISEAIMNMQENSMQLSYHVFQGCGKPKASGMGRSSRGLPDSFSGHFSPYNPEELPTAPAGGRLEHLVSEVKEKLRSFRTFWWSLPETLCDEEKVADEHHCWTDPELDADAQTPEAGPDAALRQQIMALRMMSTKLRSAYEGHDVFFQDSNDESSGSGSGSGSTHQPRPFTTEAPPRDPETSDPSSAAPGVRLTALPLLLLMMSGLVLR